jgi:predicted RNA-binding Zn-ribbon protein involved in translation (DUF1610 family)
MNKAGLVCTGIYRFGDHIRSANECARMPLTGEVIPGEAFYCPHCGALYAVTHSRRSVSESNISKCVVCGSTMDERKPTTARIYKLIHRLKMRNRPRDFSQAAKFVGL